MEVLFLVVVISFWILYPAGAQNLGCLLIYTSTPFLIQILRDMLRFSVSLVHIATMVRMKTGSQHCMFIKMAILQ